MEEFAHSKRLAGIAAKLLQVDILKFSEVQVPRIRLYQTTAFFKPAVGNVLNQATAWHRDLNLVPVDTNNYLTMW